MSTAETGREPVFCGSQDVPERFGRNGLAESCQETLQIDNMAQIPQITLNEIDI
jgi:hypothetical protein